MARLWGVLEVHGTELLFNLAAFLIVYLVARLFRASPLVAMCFGVLPLLLAFLIQHPTGPARLFALLD